jgi:alcohol dehydrogenase-like protein
MSKHCYPSMPCPIACSRTLGTEAELADRGDRSRFPPRNRRFWSSGWPPPVCATPTNISDRATSARARVPPRFPKTPNHACSPWWGARRRRYHPRGRSRRASVGPGDHVASSFFPICGHCKMCTTGHSKLCDLGAATFAPGQISDGTVRYHFEGWDLNVMAKVGTFAEHGVVHEASAGEGGSRPAPERRGPRVLWGDHRVGLGGLPRRGQAG